jgi:NADPH2:quinone reductase
MTLKEAACLPETCFHRLVEPGDARPAEGGPGLAGPWRHQRHRHHRDPDCPRAWRAGLRHRRISEKVPVCRDLGAEQAWNYREADWSSPDLREAGGADVILDMVGGSYIARNIKALADDGRLVQIAFLQGAKAEINLAEVMTRRLTITGSTLRPQSDLAKARIAAAGRGPCLADDRARRAEGGAGQRICAVRRPAGALADRGAGPCRQDRAEGRGIAPRPLRDPAAARI